MVSVACSSKPSDSADASAAAAAGDKSITVPPGTAVSIRLGNSLSSKTSKAGEHFTGTLAQPIEVAGQAAVPAGAEVAGHVMEAEAQGHFKGAAVLSLTLDSITINGESQDIKTSSLTRSIKGKGKRTAVLIGGGTGAGALIGGLAGGGKGALIGAAAGAGAGTAGAAFTGNKEIVLPAESVLTFKLADAITVKM